MPVNWDDSLKVAIKMALFTTIGNIFKISDLRNKILFTVVLLMIYRVGFHIPVPGFDQAKIAEILSN